MQECFSNKRATFGKYRRARNVPIELDTVQKPHPPLWMGVSSVENRSCGTRADELRCDPAAGRDAQAVERQGVASQIGRPNPSIKMGMGLFVVVGETDAEAQKLADRAYRVWHHSFHYLYHLHGRSPVHGERADNFPDVERRELGVAGSPQTVIDVLSKRIAEAGNNYLMCQLMFGDMTPAEALRSIELFAREVMPALRVKSPAPALS